LLQVLSLLLEAAGFSLVHVMSGAATLAFLAACELLPDLILLDVSATRLSLFARTVTIHCIEVLLHHGPVRFQ
jgi:CheY-like chemotaxis protein